VKLFYRILGKGEPLIILHGLFGLSDNWFTLGKSLSESYEVILVDLRNHGQSPHSSQFTYHSMCDDLLDLYEELHINKAILIGHSMGGKVAMQFALDNPNFLDKLIVVDISPKQTPMKHLEIIKAMLDINFDKLKTRKEVEQQLELTIKNKQVLQLLTKNLYWVDQTRLAWKLNIEGINNNIDEIFKEITGNVPFIASTLFIKGALSDYIKEEDLVQIKILFPNFMLSTIENAGHWVHADNPIAFLNATNEFLYRT